MTLIKRANELKNKLSAFRPLTEGEVDRLREEYVIKFTYNSNAIEGSTLSLDETALIIKDGITVGGKSVREHLEAIGHRDAYFYIEELVKERSPLSERIIKDIHTLVLMDRQEDKGRYRRLPVTIRGTDAVLCQPYEILMKMEHLINEYLGEMQVLDIIERTALFHLKFESIHPFIDGNGRTGRLIMNLELMKEGYLPIDVKFSDREKYVNAFKAWNKDNDAKDMIDLVGNYVIESLENRLDIMKMADLCEKQDNDMKMF